MVLSNMDIQALQTRLPMCASKIYIDKYCKTHKSHKNIDLDFSEHPETIQQIRRDKADKNAKIEYEKLKNEKHQNIEADDEKQ